MINNALIIDERADIDWAGFEHRLNARFGVNAIILTKEGFRRTMTDLNWANKLCELIKTSPQGARRICDTTKAILIHEAMLKGRFATDECDAGIYRMVVPIICKGAVEGFVSVCGRPYVTADRIYTYFIHQTIDEDEERIKGLLAGLNPIDYRSIKEIKAFIAGYGRNFENF